VLPEHFSFFREVVSDATNLGRQMNDDIDILASTAAHVRIEQVLASEINQRQVCAQILAPTPLQVVDHSHMHFSSQEALHPVRTDKPGTPCHQNPSLLPPLHYRPPPNIDDLHPALSVLGRRREGEGVSGVC